LIPHYRRISHPVGILHVHELRDRQCLTNLPFRQELGRIAAAGFDFYGDIERRKGLTLIQGDIS
jgi:hypothetical protein